MLSLFPSLFDWSWYVPLFFRLYLAYYALEFGYRIVKQARTASPEDRSATQTLGGIIFALGVVYFVGASIQVAGSVGFIFALSTRYFRSRTPQFVTESPKFYALVAIVALSLVFLGAGPYAIDLPL